MQGLSDELRDRVESALGRGITAAKRVDGGCTPAIRLRVTLDDGSSAFVKAATNEHTVTALHEERRVYDHVRAPFVPHVRAWAGDDSAPVLILEDLSDAHWPPPWSPEQVRQVNAAIDAVHATPPPPDCKRMVDFANGLTRWGEVERNPAPFLGLGLVSRAWLDRALPALREQELTVSPDGDDFCHLDVRSDNLCLRGADVLFVDWNWSCVGNGAVDRAFFLPSLAAEGGPPPDEVMPAAPGCAALVSGFFAAGAGLPPIPSAPKVRPLQLRQLRQALPWAVRALDLSALDGPNVST